MYVEKYNYADQQTAQDWDNWHFLEKTFFSNWLKNTTDWSPVQALPIMVSDCRIRSVEIKKKTILRMAFETLGEQKAK